MMEKHVHEMMRMIISNCRYHCGRDGKNVRESLKESSFCNATLSIRHWLMTIQKSDTSIHGSKGHETTKKKASLIYMPFVIPKGQMLAHPLNATWNAVNRREKCGILFVILLFPNLNQGHFSRFPSLLLGRSWFDSPNSPNSRTNFFVSMHCISSLVNDINWSTPCNPSLI